MRDIQKASASLLVLNPESESSKDFDKIVDENTDDVFISSGLGYTSFDKIKNAL